MRPSKSRKRRRRKTSPRRRPRGLPLKPNRTIEFTTDEGTWVSLDVSPDGKTIVFDLLGDLYTVPIDGGEAKAITTGPGVRQPAAVFARRQVDRVRQRPRRRREPVGRGQGRLGRPAADQGQAEPVRLAVVDARRRLRAGLAAAAAPVGGVRALDVPHPRRVGSRRSPRARPSPTPSAMIMCIRSAPSPRTDGKHLYYTKRNKLFNAYNNLDFPLSQVVRRDRTTGDEDTITEAPGSALPAAALARWVQARLRHAGRQPDRAAHPRSGDRRGALAQAAGPARRTRVAVHPRPDPRLRLHARRQVRAGGLRRQDPPDRRPDRRGPGDPDLGARCRCRSARGSISRSGWTTGRCRRG